MPDINKGQIIRPRTTPGWEFFHRYDVSCDEFQLFMRVMDYQGQRWAVNPLAFSKVPSTVPIPQSLAAPLEGSSPDVNGFLQAALEVAWEIGLRPQGYADPANELTATRYHLEDMRTLAKLRERQ